MPSRYRVEQGDHVSGIASAQGFAGPETIWNYPDNSDLKAKRDNPHVLLPGDELVIPDIVERSEQRPTDNHHRFVKKGPRLKLRVTMEHQYHEPLSAASCDFVNGLNRVTLSMSSDGGVTTEIAPNLKEASLEIQELLTAGGSSVQVPLLVELKIGYLDPIDEPSGQRGRLKNLGYYPLAPDQIDEKLFAAAIEEFQCDEALEVDGICGPATQSKLKRVHGC